LLLFNTKYAKVDFASLDLTIIGSLIIIL